MMLFSSVDEEVLFRVSEDLDESLLKYQAKAPVTAHIKRNDIISRRLIMASLNKLVNKTFLEDVKCLIIQRR